MNPNISINIGYGPEGDNEAGASSPPEPSGLGAAASGQLAAAPPSPLDGVVNAARLADAERSAAPAPSPSLVPVGGSAEAGSEEVPSPHSGPGGFSPEAAAQSGSDAPTPFDSPAGSIVEDQAGAPTTEASKTKARKRKASGPKASTKSG